MLWCCAVHDAWMDMTPVQDDGVAHRKAHLQHTMHDMDIWSLGNHHPKCRKQSHCHLESTLPNWNDSGEDWCLVTSFYHPCVKDHLRVGLGFKPISTKSLDIVFIKCLVWCSKMFPANHLLFHFFDAFPLLEINKSSKMFRFFHYLP